MAASNSSASFAKGELAPDLQGRNDVSIFRLGLNTLRNFLVMRFGGIQTRPGTAHVGRVKSTADGKVRLIPFIFSQSVAFMLEFGNLYIRFIKNGAYVTETAKNITAINLGTGFITSVGHGFGNGDKVQLASILGTTELNGRPVLVAGKTVDTFRVADLDGTLISLSAFTTYISGGTASRVYTLTTTYVTADLPTLNYVQSANVLTIVHQNYAPADLTRVSDASWTLNAKNFKPMSSFIAIGGVGVGATGTAGGAGANSFRYQISIKDPARVAGTESYADDSNGTNGGLEIQKAISGATNANPCVVTVVAHGYSNGDTVCINGISTMASLNAIRYVIANVTANTFELVGVNSTTYSPYVGPEGFSSRPYVRIDACATGTAAAPVVITFKATYIIPTIYRIYREEGGLYGLIGEVSVPPVTGLPFPTITFLDIGFIPDTSDTPQIPTATFSSSGNYPACVCYYQQRLCLSNTVNESTAVWMSVIGDYNNFAIHFPPQSKDSVKAVITGNNEINPILGMADVRRLILFTAAGEWQVSGNASGLISATDTQDVRECSTYGSTTMRPLIINGEALYVQAQGGMIRNLEYKFTSDNYDGTELSLTANHLLEGYTVVDWAYQKIPNSIVWVVRSDGQLLALTYVKEQQVTAWAHCDSLGQVTPISSAYPVISSLGSIENACCIPEGGETALYLVINRTLYGSNLRYVERLSTRAISSIKTYNGMDSALTYNGFNTGATTMQFSGGSSYTYGEHLTLTASAATFATTDIGKAFFVYTVPVTPLQPIQEVRFVPDVFVSTTVIQGHVQGEPVPASLVSGTSTNWARAVKAVAGLWHLKNQAVSVLGDGYVLANPLNQLYPIKIVDSLGNLTVDTDRYYAIITVGLPITADAETLDVYTANPEEDINKKMIVTGVSVFSRQSRGIWAGAAFPAIDTYGSSDTSQAGLERINPRDAEDDGYDTPHNLQATERLTMPIQGSWGNQGRCVFRVQDPVPATILAISANGMFTSTQPPKKG